MRWMGLAAVLLFAGAAAFLLWPRVHHLDPPPPPSVSAAEFVEDTEVSRIFVTAFFPRERLEAELEAAAPLTMKGERLDPIEGPFRDDKLRWNARRAPIRVSTASGKIEARTKLAGRVRINGRLAGVPVAAQADLNAQVAIRARPRLLQDWRLEPNLSAQVAVTRARVPIKRLGSVNVRRFLVQELEAKVAEFERRLNRDIGSNPFIEETATRAQARLCGVHPVDMGGQAGWLRVRPEGWEAGQPRIEEGGLRVGLGLRARLDMQVGDKPPAPDCGLDASLQLVADLPEPALNLSAAARIGWDALSDYATRELAGREIAGGAGGQNLSITPKRVVLSPFGSGILVSVGFSGKTGGWLGARLDGDIHLIARPVLDVEKEELRLEDVSLWVDSAQAISATGAIGALAGPFVEDLVARKAVLDLSGHAQTARLRLAAAQARLNEGHLAADGVALSGAIDRIDLRDVVVSEAGLLLRVTAQGALSVEAQ